MKGGLSTGKLYVFKSYRHPVLFYPLRDPQREAPVDWCARCGGEIYPFDPVDWNEERPVCPACTGREERERKTRERE